MKKLGHDIFVVRRMEASVFGQGSKAGKQWKGEGDAETSERWGEG